MIAAHEDVFFKFDTYPFHFYVKIPICIYYHSFSLLLFIAILRKLSKYCIVSINFHFPKNLLLFFFFFLCRLCQYWWNNLIKKNIKLFILSTCTIINKIKPLWNISNTVKIMYQNLRSEFWFKDFNW